MGRSYAGILGTLAGTLVLCRGAISGGGLEVTMLVACGAMFGFGAIGFIAGALAESFTAEGVRQKFLKALEEQQQSRQRAVDGAAK
jgi:hypothetical protein